MVLTWFVLWPLLIMPSVVVIMLGAIPSLTVFDHVIGGFMFREKLIRLLELFLPSDHIAQWHLLYDGANESTQILMHSVIAVNINLLILPLLYVVGTWMIAMNGWFASQTHASKTNILRR